jgi:hypothetical protein
MAKLMRKIVPSVTLTIGIVWVFCVVFMYLAMAGISTPVSNRAVILSAAEWFVGPVSLIVGSALVLAHKAPKISLALSVGAALVLSGIVVSTVNSALHPQPLEAPPAYEFYAILIGTTILCDMCVLWLTLNWRQRRRSAGVNTGGA